MIELFAFRLPQKQCGGMLAGFFSNLNKTMPLSQKRVMQPKSIMMRNQILFSCELFLKVIHFALRGCCPGTRTQALQTTSLGSVAHLLGLLFICLRHQQKLFRFCLKNYQATSNGGLCTDEPANETSVTDHPKHAHVCLVMIP